MRILHILNHTQRQNGHVHAAVDLACAQAALGHAVCIANGGGDFDTLLHSKAVSTVRVDHRRSVPSLAKAIFSLHGHVREFRPEVVHAHMMTSAVLAFPICRVAGIPLITTVHNEFEKSAILMGLGTRVIAVSDAVSAAMQRRGISVSKLHVVLNGTIGAGRLEARAQQPAALQSPSILFVGGLHPRKGLADLFCAFDIVHQSFPGAHLYVIGDGPFRGSYEETVSSLACAPAVTFLGSVTDPYPYMLAADIFILPSHADPAPLVVSEAREAGCAIIGTDVDGIPQLLDYGEAGILVPPRDPSSLANAVLGLLRAPEQIAAWKIKSQLRIENLSIERVARETMQVYLAATAPKRGKMQALEER
ncbi:glycosyltransferase [Rhizobium sp. R72]|uniref:glycosyltransferase family 4 protein n=1 Tax=unclassified Rhizobium TaxID=2613769 RepID=UPI000B52D173|nr:MULTISPECIES: glycosyltransferase family 4 protein [unclassified Rhizobium]OWW00105.1 glycosyltransferase [Rhizobium sp. R72]OWW00496.1 glycosyltransferase [Rhizobium sp. R711]